MDSRHPPRRVTQRDIALASGVSQMTVSLALRNSPKVSPPVRDAIRRAARRLGWRPDPVLAALVGYRHQSLPPRDQGVIAWVTNWPTRAAWRDDHPVYAAYFRGAADRAASLGYRLEEFWLGEPGITPARLGRILVSRGITGLLLPPQPRAQERLELPWERLAAVAFGFTLADPPLHVATNHHFRSAVVAMRELHRLGYRRVGLLLDERHDARVGYGWMAGCLMEQRLLPRGEQVPLLSAAALSQRDLRDYLRRHRPDALLTNFRQVLPWLREMGIAVPRDLGVASLSVTERNRGMAGIDENSAVIGESALDLLATMLQRNELGIPAVPRRIMIEGRWVDGGTVRRLAAAPRFSAKQRRRSPRAGGTARKGS